MTNISATIARFKGWKCYEQPRGGYRLQYIYEPGRFPWDNYRDKELIKSECVEIDMTQIDLNKLDGMNKIPDYRGDARLYMALFEEMAKAGTCELTYNFYMAEYKATFNDLNGKRGGAISKNVGTSICLAYMRLHGLE
jgi:hypothetical protein